MAIREGVAAFLAGILLIAVPTVAMVASTTAPTELGHWVVLLIGLALVAYGVFRGTAEICSRA